MSQEGAGGTNYCTPYVCPSCTAVYPERPPTLLVTNQPPTHRRSSRRAEGAKLLWMWRWRCVTCTKRRASGTAT